MNTAVAEVAVDKTSYSFDKLFTYSVPERLLDVIKPGIRVIVPFGRGNKKQQGMVFSVKPAAEAPAGLKELVSAIDSEPVLNEDLLSAAKYMVKNTFCTYYDAVHTILPNGINYKINPKYSLCAKLNELDYSLLDDCEKAVVLFLNRAGKAKKSDDFFDNFDAPAYKKAIEKLVGKGIIKKTDEATQRISDKTIRMIRLSDDFDSALKYTPKQKSVLDLLARTQAASVKEVCELCSVTQAVVKNLHKAGCIELFDREILRTPGGEAAGQSAGEIKLNAQQQAAFDGISAMCKSGEPGVALLHGITGSGKTSVFLKLIASVINDNKQVIMLVPEISLTPQTLGAFRNIFDKDVAVLHSSLSMGEQLDEWKRIKRGGAKIVVGTRSAVFAPFDNIGLIIMDEEGEFSYKSDKTPRYHARDIAKLRCLNNKCPLLLASATPLVDSYYYAKTGKYSLFTLDKRYNNSALPVVEIVDLKKEPSRGAHAISERLLEELNVNLQNNEQSILLLNRRGYNTHAQCVECGTAIVCPNCSVAMTYHKVNGRLMCHYCGRSERLYETCPTCGSRYIRLSGFGTQKLEEELSDLLPSARVVRMDTDTTYSKYAFEKKFNDFRNGEYDIMLGTQMIAKGHDFPNVTLTGVISADQTLYSGDFRCGEKTFSLLTQVVGRSGRGNKRGRAIIQTYSPDEPVIAYAAAQNYSGFYEDEIEARRALLYPPFCDLCVIGVSGADEQRVINAANTLAAVIISAAKQTSFHEPLKLLGPSQANIYRINKKFRYRLIVKCRMNSSVKKFIRFVLNGALKLPELSDISVYADINGEIS